VRFAPVGSKRQTDQMLAEGVADTVRTTNVISQLKFFVARCFSSCVGYVFDIRSVYYLFPANSQAIDVG
jgi:hypothetical protein